MVWVQQKSQNHQPHQPCIYFQSLEKLSLRDPDEDEGDCPPVSEDAPGVEAQLLITLSNCAFMRRVVLPRLLDSLVRASYPQDEVK